MNWCCPAFHGNYEVAGERGFAILVDRNAEKHPRFILQHRAFKKGFEQKLMTQTPFSLVSETQIRFCPWCGTNLVNFYQKCVDALARPQLKI
jgi:hypothetical protein